MLFRSHRCIDGARRTVRKAATALPAEGLKAAVAATVSGEPAARLDYVEFFDPETLEPMAGVSRGCQMALAVFMGRTRLIDNGRL